MPIQKLHQSTINSIGSYFRTGSEDQKKAKIEAAQKEVLELANKLLSEKTLKLSEFASSSLNMERCTKWVKAELAEEHVAVEISTEWSTPSTGGPRQIYTLKVQSNNS